MSIKYHYLKAFTTLIEQEFGQTDIYERAPASLDTMIAELKNISVTSSVCFDKMFYLLIIVEEAISWAQASGAESGDLVKY